MEIREQLSDKLLDNVSKKCQLNIEIYKQSALAYAQMEGAIVVLSDMQENKSFIYKSAAADELGLKIDGNPAEINSIWEEEMLKKIHPDDRLKKYIHELRFFRLLDTLEIQERKAYSVVSKIRMKDKNDTYRWVKHRMFYVYSPDNGRLRLALCLYNMALTSPGVPDFMIVNVIKGEVVVKDKLDYKNILSPREWEVLKFIGEGYASKEIAGLLSISINTVNRHRQNILEKLKVKNSTQAFKDSFS
ncbi:DNA-binding CsgD family transcriptional regulator [Chryseobacterium vietnamense]|jgi:DNA-binding CsgD family transcriptional regulator|uniref:DNA-binding CsgD family transcriptional regulator n=1 Tax=Chryseobacterium vietnamense TaxID=866785 RepID=A0ACC6J3E7_9FLAO|nr:LuxR C-terminal-related transcriptional regulator [Chryseobacterium vietnamense]MDR6457564.1 DNA-binding CsgD family transcriptional regulator [Chryseobacterium vietnamense]MDR6486299.1 DNA-binding CsgD family transcriptional regulator [Chryseobacterium vietnamense]